VLAALTLAGPAGAAQAAVGINPGLGPVPPLVLRATPADTWHSLFALGERGEFAVAAHLLDLGDVVPSEQPAVGREVAEKLYQVVQALRARLGSVPPASAETTSGETDRGEVVLLRFQRESVAGEVRVRRVLDPTSGETAWLFSRQTVATTPLWHRLLVLRKPLAAGAPLNVGLGQPPTALRRATPRECLLSFLETARQGRFAEAAHYLDLGALPPERQAFLGPRLARRLMFVLERRPWIDPETVADDPLGRPQPGMDDDRQRLGAIPVHEREIPVVLARYLDTERRFGWVFARETVQAIDTLYAAHGYGWLGDHLPRVFFTATVAGLQLWQWAALALVVGLGYGVARLVGHWLAIILRRLAARTRVTWDDYAVATLDGPLGIVLWAVVIAAGGAALGVSPQAAEVLRRLWHALLIGGAAWYGFKMLDAIASQLGAQGASGNAVALAVAPVVQKVGKFLVALLALMAVLDVVGVNVAAALAGVGLGGLAVAFAAQKTIENVFGALAIAADRPFKVGDLVRIGDVVGTVEDIGLRSTKLRTLERTLVVIPNGAVVADTIVNLTARDRMLFRTTVGLVYGTTQAQLTFVLDEVRRMLLDDPRVLVEGQRVRFVGFGASSLDIEILGYVATSDFLTFTTVAQDLNLRILEIVERSGSAFAYPSQTLYLARDQGLSPERAAAAAAVVAARQQAGELAVPEPPPALVETARRRRERGTEAAD